MNSMNITRIGNHLRVALKPSALALAMGTWLVAGTALAAPANDAFASAIDLTGTGTAGQTGDVVFGDQTGTNNADATLEAGEPNPGATNTVWFKWTAPADGAFTVNTAGSTDPAAADWDAILGIYTGTALDALTPLDLTPKDTVLPETMTVAATAGTTYYIQLAGYANAVAANIMLTWNFVATVYEANILTFGPYASIGEVFDNAAAIAWTVPFGTNLATLAPTFTLSPGATATVGGNPVVSGSPVDFSGDPVVYTVTAQGASPTVNAYTVTVTPAPDESALVWDLAGGGDWDFITDNWLGMTSNTTQPFSNFLNVIFDNTAGGTINIPAVVYPLSTTVSAASGTYTFSGGPIASGSLTKDGGGQLTIAGTSANHTYSGGTVITSGKLYLYDVQTSTGLGTGPVTLAGGVFHLDRFTCTNNVIVDSGSLFLDNGYSSPITGSITLNAPNLNITSYYAKHALSGAISGPGGFTLSGFYGGGVALSGTNSYEGPTIVTGGTVQCDNVNALGGGDLSISSTGGAKVDLNFTGTKSVASLTLGGVEQTVAGTYGSTTSDATFKSAYFSGNGMIQVGDPAYAAAITSFGTNVPGSAAVIDPVVDNAAAITWYVPTGTVLAPLAPDFVITAGSTCSDQTSGVIPVPGFDAGPVVYTVVSENTLTTNVYTVTVTVLPAESTLIWDLASGGAWNRTTPNWRGESSGFPTPYFDGVNVIFDNTAGGTIILDGNLAPLSTTVSAASGTYTFSVVPDGGSITTGSLTKDGGGTLLMAKANSYDGGTVIKNGTLRLEWPGDGVSHTTLGSGPVTLDGGTLHLNRTDLANALTVNGGALFLDNGFGSAWTGPVTLNAPNLNITAYYQIHLLSGGISGSGGITLSSAAGGGLLLSGASTYTGPTNVTAGTLQCDSPDAVASGDLSITGGKVNLNYSGTKNIASLTLGGVAKTAPGTYGSEASGADFPDDNYFTSTGTGTVTLGGASGYGTWAGTNAPGQTPGEDYDKDGVENGIEYFMGQTGSSFTAMPGLDATNTVTWTKDPAYSGTWQVQTSPDLATWTNVAGTDNGTSVSYTLAPGEDKLFVRLLVTPTP